MFQRFRSPRAAAVLALAGPGAAFASSGHHQVPQHDSDPQDTGRHSPQREHVTLRKVDLASDIRGVASVTDPNLANPRGNSLSPASPLWLSSQASDNATLYSITPGSSTATKSTTVRVTMPDSVAGPSDQVANTGTGFVLSNGTVKAPAAFIFATLDGHIFVTYDSVNPATGFEGTSPHVGAVDEFSTHGHLISRIASGKLNALWGLATAPSGWGRVAGSLLVGNFGDGRINVMPNTASTTLRRRTNEDRHHRPRKRWGRTGCAVAHGRARGNRAGA